MERKLNQLIENLEAISDLRNLSDTNPIVTRLSNPTIAQVTAIVLSSVEPHLLVLPLNVVWINFDPASQDYKKPLKRVSKGHVPGSPYLHTYTEVLSYDSVFEPQFYDQADTLLLTGTDAVGPATTTELGTVRLSSTPLDPINPVVVAEGDPRLTNARAPTAHGHPQLPATAIKTLTGQVLINTANDPQVGHVLITDSNNSAVWRRLTESDLAP